MLLLALIAVAIPQETVVVRDSGQLRSALSAAKPGTRIQLQPGAYRPISAANVHGTAAKPVVIEAADKDRPPRFSGGGSTIQLSDVSYIEMRDLIVERPEHNGINIDDGGTPDTPSHHVTLKNITVTDTPKGNNDGIKLSGLDDFKVEGCTVERWGGSAIDMVGCHRGVIAGSTFRNGGDSGIQCKGGTAEVTIRRNRFEAAGQRAVNIGGSTGLQFFRPPLDKMPTATRYEARGIAVEGCTFRGSVAPIAFVGVDGATVRFNTIYNPERWAIRILQETTEPGFVPCRRGVFENNLVVFRSGSWASGGVNVGSNTSPETFSFAHNFWFCSDRPENSRPTLPTAEVGGLYGQDPRLLEDLSVAAGSPAKGYGAHAFRN